MNRNQDGKGKNKGPSEDGVVRNPSVDSVSSNGSTQNQTSSRKGAGRRKPKSKSSQSSAGNSSQSGKRSVRVSGKETNPTKSNRVEKQTTDDYGSRKNRSWSEDHRDTRTRNTSDDIKYMRSRNKRQTEMPESPANHALRRDNDSPVSERSRSTRSGRYSISSSTDDPLRRSSSLLSINLRLITSLFSTCLIEADDIELQHYIMGYDELYVICESLGPIFKIVGSEIRAKLDRMLELKYRDWNMHYYSMMSMVTYEIGSGVISRPGFVSGCRTFLRLNRGLDFLVKFLQRVYTMEDDELTSTAACDVYSDTLANYHSWLVKKSAILLLSVGLPTKGSLVKKICGDNEEAAYQELPLLLDVTNDVLNRAHDHFLINNLLDLS